MVPSAAMATPLGRIRDPSTLTGPAVACRPCLPRKHRSMVSTARRCAAARTRPSSRGRAPTPTTSTRPARSTRTSCAPRSRTGASLRIDTEAAAAAPGVAGVFTGADLDLAPFPPGPMAPDDMLRPTLARDVVRFQGEAIAVVVAESRGAAVDAAELVEVDIEPLEIVVDPERALEDDAPQLFADKGSNLAFAGRQPPTRARSRAPTSWCAAATSTSASRPCRWSRRRPWPCPTRSPAACASGRRCRRRTPRATSSPARSGLEKDAVHVTVPNVGGGFGARIAAYPEQAAVAAAALRLGKPVRYVESRWETMIAMQHGRAQVQDVELGARSDGTLVGIRVHVIADCGAYPGDAVIMPFLTGQMASGVYAHPARGLRLSLRGDQHDAHRRLPRRRAPRGDRADRARDGPARREARHGPGRAAPAQLHPARRLPAQDGRRRHLRLGRVRARAGPRARGGGLRRRCAQEQAQRRERGDVQAARDRPVHLRRAHRASASRSAPARSTRTASSRSRPAPRPRARATRRRGRSSCRGRSACRWTTCASSTPTRARSRAAWGRWARARCRSAAAR